MLWTWVHWSSYCLLQLIPNLSPRLSLTLSQRRIIRHAYMPSIHRTCFRRQTQCRASAMRPVCRGLFLTTAEQCPFLRQALTESFHFVKLMQETLTCRGCHHYGEQPMQNAQQDTLRLSWLYLLLGVCSANCSQQCDVPNHMLQSRPGGRVGWQQALSPGEVPLALEEQRIQGISSTKSVTAPRISQSWPGKLAKHIPMCVRCLSSVQIVQAPLVRYLCRS